MQVLSVPWRLHYVRVPKKGEDIPVKFAVWQTDGAVVVAFRGTARLEDALLDASINPVPLAKHCPEITVHEGFYTGIAHCVELIANKLRAAGVGKPPKPFRSPPMLYLTGHSLGGAYATMLLLYLTAHLEYGDLLEGGRWAGVSCNMCSS